MQHGGQLRHEQGRQGVANGGLGGENQVSQVGPDVRQLLPPGLPADVLVATQNSGDQGSPECLQRWGTVLGSGLPQLQSV